MSHLWRQLLTGDAKRVQWPVFTSTVCPIRHHSHDVVATHCGGGVTPAASNWPVWIPNLNSLYSHCCSLLYLSQPAGSISSCPQLTLTEVTHFVDPRSGSLVTLGHSAPSNNMRDVISNGISDSRKTSPGRHPQGRHFRPQNTTGYGQPVRGTHLTGMHTCCFQRIDSICVDLLSSDRKYSVRFAETFLSRKMSSSLTDLDLN